MLAPGGPGFREQEIGLARLHEVRVIGHPELEAEAVSPASLADDDGAGKAPQEGPQHRHLELGRGNGIGDLSQAAIHPSEEDAVGEAGQHAGSWHRG